MTEIDAYQEVAANGRVKIRVDMADLTLEDLADVGELLGAALSDVMQGPKQALGIAAVAYTLHRRDDPTYTYEAARKLRLSDIDLVNSAESEQPSGSNGVALPSSPASGT